MKPSHENTSTKPTTESKMATESELQRFAQLLDRFFCNMSL